MAGLLETRNKLLQAKSNNKQNWLGFAVAQFLNNKPDLALEVGGFTAPRQKKHHVTYQLTTH